MMSIHKQVSQSQQQIHIYIYIYIKQWLHNGHVWNCHIWAVTDDYIYIYIYKYNHDQDHNSD